MKEETSTPSKPVNVQRLNRLPVHDLVRELPRVSAADAEKLIKRRAKDFAKDPKSLIELIKTAENFPHLKSAIGEIKLIEHLSLDISETMRELGGNVPENLRELRNIAVHRSRLALKKPRNVSSDDPLAVIAASNPQRHEDDSIEDLTKYLLNNPESAFYFLRQTNRQNELTEKPVLLAKMIASDSNLQKTIGKEGTVWLLALPKASQEALEVFSETVTMLSTPHIKSDERTHASLMSDVNRIINTPVLTVLPLEEIYELNRKAKQALIDVIALKLAELPDSEVKKSLQARLHNFQEAQHTSQISFLATDPYGVKLYDDAKEATEKVRALRKVRGMLQDPLFLASERFNQLRPYLESLNENNSLSEISRHNTVLDEIRAKNTRLRDMYTFIREIEEKAPTQAENFRLLASDFSENSQQKPMDEFIAEIKAVRTNINLLNSAFAALDDPLIKHRPEVESLRNQLGELHIHSRKFEFDNFNRELTKVRKLALDAMSQDEKAHEERSAVLVSHSAPKKLQSSMEKAPAPPENDSEDSVSSSQSESIEVYKAKPKKYKEPPPPSSRGPHH